MRVIKKSGSIWVGIVVLLVFVLALGLSSITRSTQTAIQSKRLANIHIAQSLGDAGVERAIWRLNQNPDYTGEQNLSLPTGKFDIVVFGGSGLDYRNIEVTSFVPNREEVNNGRGATRKIRAKLVTEPRESSVAFNYAVQTGSLGITMGNNAVLNGNLYSSGNLNCENNARIAGDAFLSSSPDGNTTSINNCRIDRNVRAHTVTRSSIGGWLRHVGATTGTSQSGTRTQISRVQHDIDVPARNLPISQLTIENWQSWATEGGVWAGNYTVGGGQSLSLGPKAIEGNLTISSGSTLTLTGVVWVKGNITVQGNSTIRLTPSFGPNSGIIIADNPADRSGSSWIRVENGVNILGSNPTTHPGSHIMMLSTNTRTTIDPPAIFAGNNSRAVIYYTTTGMIAVRNNAQLRAVSGGGLHLNNNATLNYDTGLASTVFSGGPGGSWKLREWQVVY